MSKFKIRGAAGNIDFTPEQLAFFLAQAERNTLIGKSIRSTAYANIVDLVSEGEIQGLVAGLKSVYLDETPIQNIDESFNFGGVLLDYRYGTQSQTYIPGFGEVQDDVNVGVKATVASPVVRQITNVNIDAVVIKITTPQLTLTDTTTGEIKGNTVQYQIQLQSNGGGYVTVVESELIGKSTSQYQKAHRIELTGSAPWDISLVRLKPDALSVYDQNEIYFDSYTEIIDVKLRYPNSAIVSLKVDAAKFSNVPRRAFHLRGLKIRIPSNATPRADGSLTYSGAWNGTFQTLYSNNPAWCLYDLLTNERYGLGSFIPESHVDKWALYSIGVYCDQLVDNGFGGNEPRFSANIYIQSQENAYRVIQDMSTIFRGMSYWSNGSITAVQDAPADPSYLYTQANVINGDFVYSGASKRARHTVALVTWNDPEDFYRPKVEYVEDQEAVATYGVIKTQVQSVGCTSRAQANRVGKWILYTEQNESEVISFKTGIEGAVARPGQIINIADSNRSGRRLGGRISSATISSIILDSDLEASHVGDTLFVLLDTGVVEERVVATQNSRTLTTTVAFSTVPKAQSIWMISSSEIEVQTFRVLSVAESSESGEIEVSGIKYDSRKYSAVEDGATLSPRNYTGFSTVPISPLNLKVTENLYNSNTGVKSKATISWDSLPGVSGYSVSYKKDDNNFVLGEVIQFNEFEIFEVSPGTYDFQVSSISPIGKKSPPSTLRKIIYGKTAKPLSVSNFSMFPHPNANNAFLTWDQATDLDVIVGGAVRIRHTPRIIGQTWSSSIDIVDYVAGSATFATAPLMYGTYLAKFVDSSGNESETESIIVTSIPIPYDLNVVSTQTETGSFSGAKVNTEYNPSLGGLTLSTTDLWDTLGPIDDILSLIDWNGDVIGAGLYYFANNYIDLGQVFSSNLTANIKILAFDTGTYFDDITNSIDDWVDIDGANLAAVNAKLYVRTTEDNPAASPAWSVYKPFFTGSYLARAFEFRLDLTSTSTTQNLLIEECQVVIDMPDRVEEHNSKVSGASAYTLSFNFPFNAVPSVGIMTHNLVSGDYYTITSKTKNDFVIEFRNSSNVLVSRTFDAIVKGYGLQG